MVLRLAVFASIPEDVQHDFAGMTDGVLTVLGCPFIRSVINYN